MTHEFDDLRRFDRAAKRFNQLFELTALLGAHIFKLDTQLGMSIGATQKSKSFHSRLAANLKVMVEAKLAFGQIGVVLQLVKHVATDD